MAWGLEARVPFLDKAFLEVAMNIDPKQKMFSKGSQQQVDEDGCPIMEKVWESPHNINFISPNTEHKKCILVHTSQGVRLCSRRQGEVSQKGPTAFANSLELSLALSASFYPVAPEGTILRRSGLLVD